MKKIFLLAITVFMAIMANAQISVQAGYLLNTCKTKVSPDKYSNSYNGIMVAADYNLNLTGTLSVAPGWAWTIHLKMIQMRATKSSTGNSVSLHRLMSITVSL